MASDSRVQKFEINAASYLAESAGADEETEQMLKNELTMVNDFIALVKEGVLEVYQSEPIQNALNQAKGHIQEYCKGIREHIETLKSDIKAVDRQETFCDEQNRERNMQKYEKEQELHKLGFFDGAKKRELQAEIADLQPLPPPYDFEAKRQELNNQIKFLEANIEPLQNKIKGLLFYQDEAERKLARQTPEQNTMQRATKQDESRSFDPQEFYDYLRDKGFNDKGANETINRISKGKPDREDLYQLRSFQKDMGAIKEVLPQTLQNTAQEALQSFHRATRGR